MLSRVRDRSSMYNNDALVAQRFVLELLNLTSFLFKLCAYFHCLDDYEACLLEESYAQKGLLDSSRDLNSWKLHKIW